jgi:hypothetical protein
MRGDLLLKLTLAKFMIKLIGVSYGMLEKMGFADKWIHWMMLCVSSVNYSALVNFEKIGLINPDRGLRQGDPLSPYLFILVTEGLYIFLNQKISIQRRFAWSPDLERGIGGVPPPFC